MEGWGRFLAALLCALGLACMAVVLVGQPVRGGPTAKAPSAEFLASFSGGTGGVYTACHAGDRIYVATKMDTVAVAVVPGGCR